MSILVGWLMAGEALSWESPDGVWRDPSNLSRPSPPAHLAGLLSYRMVELNLARLEQQLAGLASFVPGDGPLTLSFPLPDGDYAELRIEPVSVMHSQLAARYPEIRTFQGRLTDEPASWGRFDLGPDGFHGMLVREGETLLVNPHDRNLDQYILFRKSDLRRAPLPELESFELGMDLSPAEQTTQRKSATRVATGSQLRTYRTAVLATGEYTQYHGGTVDMGLAAVVSAINRVDGIFRREFAVALELVADNDKLIYTDPLTDGLSNDSTLLGQIQDHIDGVIGFNNYDLGHGFSTGAGGQAFLGVVCTASKALGITGSSVPTGDPFWVDYVAHEMGHQFNATHSFNGSGGSCAGGRIASTAYEPGSGSTIMGYAGICNSDDLQTNSDPYLNAGALAQISAFVSSGSGSTCGSLSSLNNEAPLVNAGSGGQVLPIDTPFVLTGAASDANGDSLTYSWEQLDQDQDAQPLGSAAGNSPLFRVYDPVTSPTRWFPRLETLAGNLNDPAELLPGYSRNLRFRLTARDGRGGVDSDDIQFSVTSGAGPFKVLAPNGGEIKSGGFGNQIDWEVSGTQNAPVSCNAVDIRLSIDGGLTFDLPLLAGTPNDGSAVVELTNLDTSTARIGVFCANSIFFDISDENFTILASSASCDGAQVIVDNQIGFPKGSTTSCMASSSITTSGDVIIPAGANGLFHAPVVQLRTGFRVQPGASFRARMP